MKKPTTWFWVIAGIFLLWNAFGCYLYVIDVSLTDAQYAEKYGQVMADARHFYPSWAFAAYAVAVWGGLVAAGLLLLRRRLAVTAFVISLIAAAICFIPNFISAPLREAGGATYWLMPLIVVAIGLVEVWFARRESAKGSLR